jgi:hypothetical protein
MSGTQNAMGTIFSRTDTSIISIAVKIIPALSPSEVKPMTTRNVTRTTAAWDRRSWQDEFEPGHE